MHAAQAVFIVGCPRSGTTLLRLLLCEHPQVFISSEGAYIPRLRIYMAENAPTISTEKLLELHERLRPYLELERFLSLPQGSDLIAWCEHSGAAIDSIIKFYATWEAVSLGKTDLRWWGDNAPYHALCMPFFASTFPDSRFIVMIRDPRDTYASFLRSFPGRTLDSFLAEWQEVHTAQLIAKAELGPSRVYESSYERLVTWPEEELRRICRFLEIDYKSSMREFFRSEPARCISHLPHHANVLSPIFGASVGCGMRELSRDVRDRIEARLCNSMRHLGYLPETAYDAISRSRLIQRVGQ